MLRLGPSLAAALLDELFEHPARDFYCCAHICDPLKFSHATEFSRRLLGYRVRPGPPQLNRQLHFLSSYL